MLDSRARVDELFVANFARIRLLPRVQADVVCVRGQLDRSFPADVAGVRSNARMKAHVNGQAAPARERPVANLTPMGFLLAVDEFMIFQRRRRPTPLAAHSACVWFLPSMQTDVVLQFGS